MADLGAPTSYLLIAPGVDVYDAAGERIGTLEHVLADDGADIFDGLLIDVRAGPGGMRFADADQVGALHERGVVLKVSEGQLHAPAKNPAALSAEPGDEQSALSARLHRAWDYLSGRY